MKPKPPFRWEKLSWGNIWYCFDAAGKRIGGVVQVDRAGEKEYIASYVMWPDSRPVTRAHATILGAMRSVEVAVEAR